MVEQNAGPYRERTYPPLRTLGLFIGQALNADGACQDAVSRNLSERMSRGAGECSLSTGPYCKARGRLSMDLVVQLQRLIGQRLEQAQPQSWRWQGRSVKILDGTTVSMPDTPTNQQAFPQSRTQQPGLGFPIARLVAILSLGHGAVLDWAMAACRGEGTSEQALFRQLTGSLEAGEVLLADGYYCTYWNLAVLRAKEIDVVVHQHGARISDFRRGKRLGRGDHIVQWSRPERPHWMDEATYAALPETLRVREVRVNARVLVTTLLDSRQAPPAELDRLYGSRWNIEVWICAQSRRRWVWTSCAARARRWSVRKSPSICLPTRWCARSWHKPPAWPA